MKNFLKTMILTIITSVAISNLSFVFAEQVSKNDMLTNTTTDNAGKGVKSFDTKIKTEITVVDFLKSIKDYFVGLVAFVAVCVFLYNGFCLLKAEGKDEEMKKALTSFTYSVVGLAVIPLSYVLIKLVTSFNF
ncbi:MAG: hypothetical protein PHF46_03805 [Candidatus Gracilibacteria bacterium]|nr:hypothetical protein [Candidatus Gracilibacteria bacterium]MDD4530964.1 hypothetical protein [Candidatus Gracilibacteria bacterium]